MSKTTAVNLSGSNRRALIFLAIGAGILVLFLAFKMLTGGGGSKTAATPSSASTPAAQAATAATAPAPPVPAGPAPNATRDPFKALR